MTEPLISPLLAANDHSAITVLLIAVFSIIGWIIKLVGNQSPKAPPVVRRPRPPVGKREPAIDREVEIFVEDTSSRRTPSRRPAQKQSKPQPKPPAARAADVKGNRKPRPGEDISKRHTTVSQGLGGAVKQHTGQHMADHVSQESQQRMAPRMESQALNDLGAPVASTKPATAAGETADSLASMLRHRSGMQRAMILNLILSPPPGRSDSRRR